MYTIVIVLFLLILEISFSRQKNYEKIMTPPLTKLKKKINLLTNTVFELINFEFSILKYGIFINFSLWLQRIWIYFFGTHQTDLNLSNKTVLITGAANGIGRTTAYSLLNLENPPSRLILWDVESLEEFKEISKNKSKFEKTKIFCDHVDLSNLDKLDHKLLRKHLGSSNELHYFIAIAGVADRNLSVLQDFTSIQKNLNVNYLSNVKLTKMLLEGYPANFSKKDENELESYNLQKIIYISSNLAFNGLSYFSEYSASKSALKIYAESVQAEIFLAQKYEDQGQYWAV